jgi:hypothetical protein
MNRLSPEFDQRLADWLEDDPGSAPSQITVTVLAALPSIRQRRRPWFGVGGRNLQMPSSIRLLAVAAVLAVAGASALLLASGQPDPPPAWSVAPSGPAVTPASTTGAIDTSRWVAFTSARYGYTIRHPADWETTAASRQWTLEQDRTDWISPAQDRIIDEEASYPIGWHGFAVDLPAGSSADQWIDAFFEGTTAASGCLVLAADMPSITVGGYHGKLADQQACDDTIAFVFVQPRMYVFTIGRENQVALFKAFLSTVSFEAGAAGRTYVGDWTAYTSPEYGFTLGVPPGWSQEPATRPWTYEADGANVLSHGADAFQSPPSDVRVSAWLVPFEAGEQPEQSWEAVETWIESYCPKTDITSCDAIPARAEHLCVESRDCHPGLLVPYDGEVQAYFFGGVSQEGGMTVVSVWWEDNAAATARFGGSRRLLEGFLETMNVWPENRKSYEVGTVFPPPTPQSSAP